MFGINFGGAKKQQPAPEGEFVTARLNARLQPMDRGDYFEDPLIEEFEKNKLGDVTGGGTQLADEPAGIEFCDLEIMLHEVNDEALKAITDKLESLGAPKGSKLIVESDGREIPFGTHEGIGIFLNGTDLPDKTYEECDVNHVIDTLNLLMGEKGEFRGHWQGSKETALYCYGPSFEDMREAISGFLSDYPLCKGARVEQIA